MVTRIIKIGGASITDKNQFECVNLENIDFIVNLFRNNYENLILIHGAGSFGHHQAKEFRLNQGYQNTDDFKKCHLAVCDTRRSLGRLQQYLLNAFLHANIPVVCISPFHFLTSNQFELTNDNYQALYQHIEYVLQQGFVPLLHGDVILDRKVHWRILSGDDLLLKLAEYFHPRQCLFLTSVPGILRSDGSIIEEFILDENQFNSIESHSSTTIDVTGSMQNKVSIASEIVRLFDDQCQVLILQGVSENAKQILSSSSLSSMNNEQIFDVHGCTRIFKRKNKID